MPPALTGSLAAAGLLAGWPQRAAIARLASLPGRPRWPPGRVTAVLLGALAARVPRPGTRAWSWPRPAGWPSAPSRWPSPTSPSAACPTRSPRPLTRAPPSSCCWPPPPAAAAGGQPAPGPPWLRALLGGLALAGFYLLLMIISPSGMSLGDVKLAASLGTLLAWFGWRVLIAGGAAGFLLGGLGGVGAPGEPAGGPQAADPVRPVHDRRRVPGRSRLAPLAVPVT